MQSKGEADLGDVLVRLWQFIGLHEGAWSAVCEREAIIAELDEAEKEAVVRDDEYLRTAEVANTQRAAEYLQAYMESHGRDTDLVFKDPRVYLRFHMALNLLEDRIDRGKEKDADQIKGVKL